MLFFKINEIEFYDSDTISYTGQMTLLFLETDISFNFQKSWVEFGWCRRFRRYPFRLPISLPFSLSAPDRRRDEVVQNEDGDDSDLRRPSLSS